MPKCIYCLSDKTRMEFDKDHVIPESFGGFENNLTLHEQQVCRDCNKYLGDNLEFFLGRDTVEGVLRYMFGIKAAEEFAFLHRSRVVFRLNIEGPLKGIILRLNHRRVEPVNQIGFRKERTGEWVFFETEHIPSQDELTSQGYVTKGTRTLRAVLRDDMEKEELRSLLERKGIKIEFEGRQFPLDMDGRPTAVEITETVDRTIFRAFAKIAFNYLTYVEGKEFALDKRFDGIRRFIRYGEAGSIRYVRVQGTPMWVEEKTSKVRKMRGHWITLEWDRKTIFSRLALFNRTVYKVIFCEEFRILPREISGGHFFNVDSREVSELRPVKGDLWTP